MFKKTVSAIVTFCFFIDSALWAAPSQAGVSLLPSRETPSYLQIEIPQDLATIEELYEAPAKPEPKLVLHVQDAHGSYEAQYKIKKLLEYLHETYQFKLLFVEGAVGKLNPEYLKFFEEPELNVEMADNLAKKGELTGSELYLVGAPVEVEAIGIEDAELYRSNLEAFQRVHASKEITQRFLTQLEQNLDVLSSQIFPPETRRLISEWKKFEAGHRDFLPYVRRLAQDSKKYLALDLESLFSQVEWPQVTRLLVIQSMEAELNRDEAQKEKTKLVEFLKSKNLSASLVSAIERLGETRTSIHLAEAGNLQNDTLPRFLLERLVEEASPKGFYFHDYPAFSLWAGFLILESELESRILFEEIGFLFRKILDQVVTGEPEKKVLELLRDEELLKKLLRLELTRKDWALAAERRHLIHPKVMASRLLRAPTHMSNPKMQLPASLRDTFDTAFRFYDFARAREAIFYKTIEQGMVEHKTGKAVLITGGFHTEGLMEKFREAETSYGVLMPRLTEKIDTSNYVSTMLQNRPTLFDIANLGQAAKMLFNRTYQRLGGLEEQRAEVIMDEFLRTLARHVKARAALREHMQHFSDSVGAQNLKVSVNHLGSDGAAEHFSLQMPPEALYKLSLYPPKGDEEVGIGIKKDTGKDAPPPLPPDAGTTGLSSPHALSGDPGIPASAGMISDARAEIRSQDLGEQILTVILAAAAGTLALHWGSRHLASAAVRALMSWAKNAMAANPSGRHHFKFRWILSLGNYYGSWNYRSSWAASSPEAKAFNAAGSAFQFYLRSIVFSDVWNREKLNALGSLEPSHPFFQDAVDFLKRFPRNRKKPADIRGLARQLYAEMKSKAEAEAEATARAETRIPSAFRFNQKYQSSTGTVWSVIFNDSQVARRLRGLGIERGRMIVLRARAGEPLEVMAESPDALEFLISRRTVNRTYYFGRGWFEHRRQLKQIQSLLKEANALNLPLGPSLEGGLTRAELEARLRSARAEVRALDINSLREKNLQLMREQIGSDWKNLEEVYDGLMNRFRSGVQGFLPDGQVINIVEHDSFESPKIRDGKQITRMEVWQNENWIEIHTGELKLRYQWHGRQGEINFQKRGPSVDQMMIEVPANSQSLWLYPLGTLLAAWRRQPFFEVSLPTFIKRELKLRLNAGKKISRVPEQELWKIEVEAAVIGNRQTGLLRMATEGIYSGIGVFKDGRIFTYNVGETPWRSVAVSEIKADLQPGENVLIKAHLHPSWIERKPDEGVSVEEASKDDYMLAMGDAYASASKTSNMYIFTSYRDSEGVEMLSGSCFNCRLSEPSETSGLHMEVELLKILEPLHPHGVAASRTRAEVRGAALITLSKGQALYFDNGLWVVVDDIKRGQAVLKVITQKSQKIHLSDSEILSTEEDWKPLHIPIAITVLDRAPFPPESKLVIETAEGHQIDIVAGYKRKEQKGKREIAFALSVIAPAEIKYDRGYAFVKEMISAFPQGAFKKHNRRTWIYQDKESGRKVTVNLIQKYRELRYTVQVKSFPLVTIVERLRGNSNPQFSEFDQLIKLKIDSSGVRSEARATSFAASRLRQDSVGQAREDLGIGPARSEAREEMREEGSGERLEENLLPLTSRLLPAFSRSGARHPSGESAQERISRRFFLKALTAGIPVLGVLAVRSTIQGAHIKTKEDGLTKFYILHGAHGEIGFTELIDKMKTIVLKKPENFLFLVEGSGVSDFPEIKALEELAASQNIIVKDPILNPFTKTVVDRYLKDHPKETQKDVYQLIALMLIGAGEDLYDVMDTISVISGLDPSEIGYFILEQNDRVQTNPAHANLLKPKIKGLFAKLLSILNAFSAQLLDWQLRSHPKKTKILIYFGSGHLPIVEVQSVKDDYRLSDQKLEQIYLVEVVTRKKLKDIRNKRKPRRDRKKDFENWKTLTDEDIGDIKNEKLKKAFRKWFPNLLPSGPEYISIQEMLEHIQGQEKKKDGSASLSLIFLVGMYVNLGLEKKESVQDTAAKIKPLLIRAAIDRNRSPVYAHESEELKALAENVELVVTILYRKLRKAKIFKGASRESSSQLQLADQLNGTIYSLPLLSLVGNIQLLKNKVDRSVIIAARAEVRTFHRRSFLAGLGSGLGLSAIAGFTAWFLSSDEEPAANPPVTLFDAPDPVIYQKDLDVINFVQAHIKIIAQGKQFALPFTDRVDYWAQVAAKRGSDVDPRELADYSMQLFRRAAWTWSVDKGYDFPPDFKMEEMLERIKKGPVKEAGLIGAVMAVFTEGDALLKLQHIVLNIFVKGETGATHFVKVEDRIAEAKLVAGNTSDWEYLIEITGSDINPARIANFNKVLYSKALESLDRLEMKPEEGQPLTRQARQRLAAEMLQIFMKEGQKLLVQVDQEMAATSRAEVREDIDKDTTLKAIIASRLNRLVQQALAENRSSIDLSQEEKFGLNLLELSHGVSHYNSIFGNSVGHRLELNIEKGPLFYDIIPRAEARGDPRLELGNVIITNSTGTERTIVFNAEETGSLLQAPARYVVITRRRQGEQSPRIMWMSEAGITEAINQGQVSFQSADSMSEPHKTLHLEMIGDIRNLLQETANFGIPTFLEDSDGKPRWETYGELEHRVQQARTLQREPGPKAQEIARILIQAWPVPEALQDLLARQRLHWLQAVTWYPGEEETEQLEFENRLEQLLQERDIDLYDKQGLASFLDQIGSAVARLSSRRAEARVDPSEWWHETDLQIHDFYRKFRKPVEPAAKLFVQSQILPKLRGVEGVVEIGAGSNRILRSWAGPTSFWWEETDWDPQVLEKMKTSGVNLPLRTRVVDLKEKLPYEDGSVPAVVSLSALDTVPVPELDRIFQEFGRIMKKAAPFIVMLDLRPNLTVEVNQARREDPDLVLFPAYGEIKPSLLKPTGVMYIRWSELERIYQSDLPRDQDPLWKMMLENRAWPEKFLFDFETSDKGQAAMKLMSTEILKLSMRHPRLRDRMTVSLPDLHMQRLKAAAEKAGFRVHHAARIDLGMQEFERHEVTGIEAGVSLIPYWTGQISFMGLPDFPQDKVMINYTAHVFHATNTQLSPQSTPQESTEAKARLRAETRAPLKRDLDDQMGRETWSSIGLLWFTTGLVGLTVGILAYTLSKKPAKEPEQPAPATKTVEPEKPARAEARSDEKTKGPQPIGKVIPEALLNIGERIKKLHQSTKPKRRPLELKRILDNQSYRRDIATSIRWAVEKHLEKPKLNDNQLEASESAVSLAQEIDGPEFNAEKFLSESKISGPELATKIKSLRVVTNDLRRKYATHKNYLILRNFLSKMPRPRSRAEPRVDEKLVAYIAGEITKGERNRDALARLIYDFLPPEGRTDNKRVDAVLNQAFQRAGQTPEIRAPASPRAAKLESERARVSSQPPVVPVREHSFNLEKAREIAHQDNSSQDNIDQKARLKKLLVAAARYFAEAASGKSKREALGFLRQPRDRHFRLEDAQTFEDVLSETGDYADFASKINREQLYDVLNLAIPTRPGTVRRRAHYIDIIEEIARSETRTVTEALAREIAQLASRNEDFASAQEIRNRAQEAGVLQPINMIPIPELEKTGDGDNYKLEPLLLPEGSEGRGVELVYFGTPLAPEAAYVFDRQNGFTARAAPIPQLLDFVDVTPFVTGPDHARHSYGIFRSPYQDRTVYFLRRSALKELVQKGQLELIRIAPGEGIEHTTYYPLVPVSRSIPYGIDESGKYQIVDTLVDEGKITVAVKALGEVTLAEVIKDLPPQLSFESASNGNTQILNENAALKSGDIIFIKLVPKPGSELAKRQALVPHEEALRRHDALVPVENRVTDLVAVRPSDDPDVIDVEFRVISSEEAAPGRALIPAPRLMQIISPVLFDYVLLSAEVMIQGERRPVALLEALPPGAEVHLALRPRPINEITALTQQPRLYVTITIEILIEVIEAYIVFLPGVELTTAQRDDDIIDIEFTVVRQENLPVPTVADLMSHLPPDLTLESIQIEDVEPQEEPQEVQLSDPILPTLKSVLSKKKDRATVKARLRVPAEVKKEVKRISLPQGPPKIAHPKTPDWVFRVSDPKKVAPHPLTQTGKGRSLARAEQRIEPRDLKVEKTLQINGVKVGVGKLPPNLAAGKLADSRAETRIAADGLQSVRLGFDLNRIQLMSGSPRDAIAALAGFVLLTDAEASPIAAHAELRRFAETLTLGNVQPHFKTLSDSLQFLAPSHDPGALAIVSGEIPGAEEILDLYALLGIQMGQRMAYRIAVPKIALEGTEAKIEKLRSDARLKEWKDMDGNSISLAGRFDIQGVALEDLAVRLRELPGKFYNQMKGEMPAGIRIEGFRQYYALMYDASIEAQIQDAMLQDVTLKLEDYGQRAAAQLVGIKVSQSQKVDPETLKAEVAKKLGENAVQHVVDSSYTIISAALGRLSGLLSEALAAFRTSVSA